MFKGCILSGNARPTLLQTYNCFICVYLRSFAEESKSLFFANGNYRSLVEVQQQSLNKKNPAKRPGYKGGTGLGMPVPMARKRERAGLRRATAYSQKSTSFFNQLKVNRILYTD